MLAICLSALIVSLAVIPRQNAVLASSSSGPAQSVIASVADRTISSEEIEKPLEMRVLLRWSEKSTASNGIFLTR